MNTPLPRRRYWPMVVALAAAACALAMGLVIAGYFYLPRLVSARLPTAQIERLGFSGFTGRVSRIGLYRTMAGPLVFGRADDPALAIGSVELDYTPGELRRRKIRCLRMRDVVINARVGAEGISLPGFDAKALTGKGKAGSPAVGPSSGLAGFTLQKIEIRGGMIHLQRGALTTRIPFHADLTCTGPGIDGIDAHVKLYFRDQPLSLTARMDKPGGEGQLSLDAPAVILDRFADWIRQIPGLEASGTAGLNVHARMHMRPFGLSAVHAELTWPVGWLTYGAIHIHAGEDGEPVVLRADSKAMHTWHISARGLRIDTPLPKVVDLPAAKADGSLRLSHSVHGIVLSGDARLRFPGLTLARRGITGRFDALTVAARFRRKPGDAAIVSGRLRLSGGRLMDRASGLHLSGVQADLPFGWDPSSGKSVGTFSIDRVARGRLLLGRLNGRLTRTAPGYTVSAAGVGSFLPGMIAHLSGTVAASGLRPSGAVFTVDVPAFQMPADDDLGRLIPAAHGVTLTGRLSARAKVSIGPSGVGGSLKVGLAKGTLAMPDRHITLEGIDARMDFPELPRVRSAPAQRIRFSRAAMGAIVVDGGSVDVQVESSNTLLVERGRLSWCGGKVDVQSLRVTAGRRDYNVGLYCQQLSLSRILEQLGAVHAKGSGTLNGRIPVDYRNGKVRFDDGFLFSTPGEGGVIQLTGTDMLTQGIPAGTPQFAQVDLAREALKDYKYNWARLGLRSQGQDVVLRLQFDGKPANPLPFVYKKSLGRFVRIKVGMEGSRFQGIGLDVNLKLPLNRLLQYKGIVKMIE